MSDRTLEEAEELIKKQDEIIENYKDINRQKASSSSLQTIINKGLSEEHNVLSYVTKQHKNILKATGSYLSNTKEQFLYAEGLAKEYKMVSRDLGLGANLSKQMSKNFKDGMVYMEKMGLDAGDLKEMMTSFVEETGRIKLLSGDEIKILSELRRGIGLSNGEVGAMSERFDLMGINIKTMGKSLNDVFSDAQKMGLNATKVVKVLENNFAGMQRMSFAGGTKAMTEMAKLAVSMRADVGEMLGMAKQFYNPEQAIEAVAELQLMGGDIAEAFGDPFEVMYLARNKPEELAKKVQSMTENMVQFNEKTGEYELPPEAIQQLDFMADKLNLNKDRVIDMAFQTSKLKDIKEAMGGGDIFDDNQMDAIAGMAKMGDGGEFVVETKTGEEISVGDTSALKQAITDGLLDSTPDAESEKEAIAQTAKNSFTSTEILSNMLQSMKAQAAVQMDFYQKLEQGTVKTREAMDTVLQDMVVKIGDAMSNSEIIQTVISDDSLSKFDTSLSRAITMVGDTITGVFEGGTNFKDIFGEIENLVTSQGKLSELMAKIIKENKNTPDPIPIPDGAIAPDGGLIVKGQKGEYQLDKMDSVIAGTNLFGGDNSNNSVSNVSGEVKIPDFNINVNLNGADGLNANDLGKSLMPILKAKILEKMGDQIFVKGGKEKDGFPTNAT